jgi:DNA-binding PadR family transcriptional regulator
MTPVFGHGRLRLYLLRLLDESPRHGYEIIQQLKERFAGLYVPSAGTIYPRLARLETEGLVRHETQAGRKVYYITDAGRAELAAKADELGSLDAEIHNSVRDLADGIAEEVRETARTVTEDLANAARAARRGPGSEGGSASDGGAGPFPFGPFPFPSFLFNGPDDPSQWSKEQWREWKQQQWEQGRQWRDQWRRNQRAQQRDRFTDARQVWKDQWARQWKDQWAEQARQWSSGHGAWAWWFGPDAEQGTTGSKDDWRDLLRYLWREGGSLIEVARQHGPLDEEEIRQARAIIDQALTDLHHVFDGPVTDQIPVEDLDV